MPAGAVAAHREDGDVRPLRLDAAETINHAFVHDERLEAMAQGYRSGACTMREVADHFGVHPMTVSYAVRHVEEVLEYETSLWRLRGSPYRIRISAAVVEAMIGQ